MMPAKRRFVLRVLVVVNLLAHVAAIAMLMDGESLRRCCGSVLKAQIMLLSLWAVFGASRLVIRSAGLLVGCASYVLSLSLVVLLDRDHYSFTAATVVSHCEIVLIYFAFITGAIVATWLAGVRLQCFAGRIVAHGSAWPQFSLRQLLALTGAVAVLLSAGNLVRPLSDTYDAVLHLNPYVLGAAGAALLVDVVAWAALSPAPPPARLALANMLAVLGSLVTAYYGHAPADELPSRLLSACVASLWLSGARNGCSRLRLSVDVASGLGLGGLAARPLRLRIGRLTRPINTRPGEFPPIARRTLHRRSPAASRPY